ncbi:Leucine Rich repeats (2 copies) [Gimesia chilikensis]|uniref:Leucine Rich repeats (2 copies) n=1 Tax=Gimesia chilikensis TaxID=2605989 RepID=A0A517WGM8_9PLAN|nr:hypothetical protein [Gimesia chilikensis]QDU04410.1 Leucine Rich repeats (2 copies) [Gimesia chilikensis]
MCCSILLFAFLGWTGPSEQARIDYVDLACSTHPVDSSSLQDQLKQINGKQQVKVLDLQGATLNSQGWEQVARITGLEELQLVGTRITDEDLKTFRNLKRLLILDLRGTQISDRGVEELAKYPRLQYVDLRGTRVSQKGVRMLRTKRPNIFVVTDCNSHFLLVSKN